MRTVIHIKSPNQSTKASFHARYLSERDRDPEREEPATRPVFTHDKDGLKHTAADRYLAGGTRARAMSNELQHVIVAFNSHDARELEKLGKKRLAAIRAKSANIEGSGIREETRKSKIEHSKLEQTERDKPFAEAVRLMMKNLEERTNLSDLRYAMSVHRHTSKTHIHLLLRREYTDKTTDEKAKLHRFPKEFLNGRNELGKAKGGLLDRTLSDALDTMIPQRQRTPKSDNPEKQDRSYLESRSHYPTHEAPDLIVSKNPVKRASPIETRARAQHLEQHGPRALRFVLRKGDTAAPASLENRPHHLSSSGEERPTIPAKPLVADAENSTSPQYLTIEEARRAITKAQNEALSKIIESSKIEDSRQSKLSPDHFSPENRTNSQVTDRTSEQTQLLEKQKSSDSRGR